MPRIGLEPTDDARRNPGPYTVPPNTGQVERNHATQLLDAWRARKLNTARVQRECRGLTPEQLQEIYQEATLVLLRRVRPWESEEHLRNALHTEIKRRALHLHRDERRHRTKLAAHAPTIYADAHQQAAKGDPEPQALAHQDQQIILEFLAWLTETEQEVFVLWAEGLRCRRIARKLGMSHNEALNASRAIEQKRKRYALLCTTGRLCGYHATTIQNLKEGKQTNEQLAQSAIAHIQHCKRCRTEHQTTAPRLRQAFKQQAAALLPLPITFTHTSWLSSILAHTKALQRPRWKTPLHASEAHARLAMMLANTGPGSRLAAPLAVAALLTTGGAIGAYHALTHPGTQHRLVLSHAVPATAPPAADPALPPRPAAATHQQQTRPRKPLLPFGPGHVIPIPPTPASKPTPGQHAAGGFAYLGAPPPTTHPPVPAQQTHIPGGGGEFSP